MDVKRVFGMVEVEISVESRSEVWRCGVLHKVWIVCVNDEIEIVNDRGKKYVCG